MPSLRTETATTVAVATTTAADMKSPLPPAPLFSCSPCVVAACTDLVPAASALQLCLFRRRRPSSSFSAVPSVAAPPPLSCWPRAPSRRPRYRLPSPPLHIPPFPPPLPISFPPLPPSPPPTSLLPLPLPPESNLQAFHNCINRVVEDTRSAKYLRGLVQCALVQASPSSSEPAAATDDPDPDSPSPPPSPPPPPPT
jgi:hypothetical protein